MPLPIFWKYMGQTVLGNLHWKCKLYGVVWFLLEKILFHDAQVVQTF